MDFDVYIVDAFAERPLTGNPAAVVPLSAWLPDATMQAIADEMSLSETVFIVPASRPDPGTAVYDIRWFTPTVEVDLVGHATLAAGHIVMQRLSPDASRVVFRSQSGPLTVARAGDALAMDMPALVPQAVDAPPGVAAALGATPVEHLAAKHHLFVLRSADEVRALAPDLAAVARLPLPAVIVTAQADPGAGCDFVSRFFAPKNGVPEDPVAGVAHCCLAPFWAQRLGKAQLVGRQLSRRGGTVTCEMVRGADGAARVVLGGQAVTVLVGRLFV